MKLSLQVGLVGGGRTDLGGIDMAMAKLKSDVGFRYGVP
jgi:hypothetical protein